MTVGIILTHNTTYRPGSVGLNHYGVHLKRKYGGPPWWKYLSGFRVSGRHTTVWIALRKHAPGGSFIMDWRQR